jgi:hypothetical protein
MVNLDAIRAHLEADPKNVLVVCVAGGYRAPVYKAKHLPLMKVEGNGLRIGKTFVFESQLRLGHYS